MCVYIYIYVCVCVCVCVRSFAFFFVNVGMAGVMQKFLSLSLRVWRIFVCAPALSLELRVLCFVLLSTTMTEKKQEMNDCDTRCFGCGYRLERDFSDWTVNVFVNASGLQGRPRQVSGRLDQLDPTKTLNLFLDVDFLPGDATPLPRPPVAGGVEAEV